MNLTLFEKKQETKDVMSFKFKPDVPFDFKPGQYLFYTLPDDIPDERGVTRYFTISSAPFEKYMMITTRISLPRRVKAGKPSSTFKKDLLKMKKADEIATNGPDGDFVVDDPNKNYVFIAGGIGITPFRSILLQMNFEKLPINVQLLYANRDDNIVFKEELDSLIQRNPNFKIRYFISPNHINNEAMKQFSNFDIFYISGPSPFVRSIRDLLKEQTVLSEKIKLDYFPGYES